jgi:hypothetical protein
MTRNVRGTPRGVSHDPYDSEAVFLSTYDPGPSEKAVPRGAIRGSNRQSWPGWKPIAGRLSSQKDYRPVA